MQLVRMVLAFLFSMSLTLATGLGLVRAAGGPVGQEADTTAQGGLGSDRMATLENQSDLDIAASIRRALVQDDALSRKAHDVKITSRGGVVTLRGPVDSPAESSRIEQLAHQVQGIKQIDNQLEIDTTPQVDRE